MKPTPQQIGEAADVIYEILDVAPKIHYRLTRKEQNELDRALQILQDVALRHE